MSIKNQRNKQKYRSLSFIYDNTVDNYWFNRARQREFELAQIQQNQRVLVVGIGTGLDIPYIPAYAEVVGIDLSKLIQRQVDLAEILWKGIHDQELLYR